MIDKSQQSKDDVENLIERKIAEAKLGIAESRLHFALWFGGAAIAVFGVFIPMFQMANSSREMAAAIEKTEQSAAEAITKVDQAIGAMEEVADLRVKQYIEQSINPVLEQMRAKLNKFDLGPKSLKWDPQHKTFIVIEDADGRPEKERGLDNDKGME